MSDGTTPLTAEGVNILASFVIRPPRARYSQRDLGRKTFQSSTLHPVSVTRTDLQLVNARGLTLECSHYIPSATESASETQPAMPVVVYLHGNGSCRVESELLFDHTLPYRMSVFSFDFSGSGKSGGEYISLGVYEKYDVETVVQYLSSCSHVSSIALWGHSMGAATATMYAGFVDPSALGDRVSEPGTVEKSTRIPRPSLTRGRSKISISRTGNENHSSERRRLTASETSVPPPIPPNVPHSSSTGVRKHNAALVNALILDSAFASFDKLANAMVQSMPLPAAVPRRLILSVGIRAVRKAVRDKAGFDVNDIDPLSASKRIQPSLATLMLQGSKDEIVHLAHAKMLFDAQVGRDIELVTMEGIDHDAPRPSFAIERAFILLQRTLFDEHGKLSLRYSNALKVRGNDCMVDGHFDDAVYLYSDALQSLVAQERKECGQKRYKASNTIPSPDNPSEPGVVGIAAPNSEFPDSAGSGETSVNDASHLWPESDEDSVSRPSPSPKPNHAPRKRLSMRFGDVVAGLSRKMYRGPGDDARTKDGGSIPPRGSEPLAPSSVHSVPSVRGATSSRDPQVDRVNSLIVKHRRKAQLAFSRDGSLRESGSINNQGVPGGRFGGSSCNIGSGDSLSSNRCCSDGVGVTTESLIRKHGLSGERKQVALALFGNRSLANLRLKKFEMALADAEFALDLEKMWIRGYQRKAAALKGLNRIEDARLCVLAGLTIAPANAALLTMEAEFEDEALAAALEASMKESRPTPSDTPSPVPQQEDGHMVDNMASASDLVTSPDAGPPETMSSATSAQT